VLRMLVQATLELAGYGVIEASSGAEALARIRGEHPDLVVLGTMSRVNGNDVLAEMQSDPATATTPVIMLTTLAQTSPATDGAGAPRRLMQPFSPRVLARLARELLPADGELQEHILAGAS
jgi:DNA-binding response OmpR family regulator